MSQDIQVEPMGGDSFRVTVGTGRGATTHLVQADRDALVQLGVGGVPPERVVRESFVFLLEREPATSILREFRLEVIGRYFPEYHDALPARLGRG